MNAAAQVDTKGVSPSRDHPTSREASKVSESDKLNADAKVRLLAVFTLPDRHCFFRCPILASLRN